MKRHVRKLFFFLLLGAIVNVAVGWVIALNYEKPRSSPMRGRVGDGQIVWLVDLQSGPGWMRIVRSEHSWVDGPPVVFESWDVQRDIDAQTSIAHLVPTWSRASVPPSPIIIEPSILWADEYAFGWPALGLGCVVDEVGYYFQTARMRLIQRQPRFQTVERTRNFSSEIQEDDFVESGFRFHSDNYKLSKFNDRVIPLRVLWPGFAINTIFYAAILWVLFAAPGRVRRWRRSQRGLCPVCAYPVGQSPTCTECGKALTISDQEATRRRI